MAAHTYGQLTHNAQFWETLFYSLPTIFTIFARALKKSDAPRHSITHSYKAVKTQQQHKTVAIMPNWTENRISVYGHANDIKRVLLKLWDYIEPDTIGKLLKFEMDGEDGFSLVVQTAWGTAKEILDAMHGAHPNLSIYMLSIYEDSNDGVETETWKSRGTTDEEEEEWMKCYEFEDFDDHKAHDKTHKIIEAMMPDIYRYQAIFIMDYGLFMNKKWAQGACDVCQVIYTRLANGKYVFKRRGAKPLKMDKVTLRSTKLLNWVN